MAACPELVEGPDRDQLFDALRRRMDDTALNG
jgi:hypothetical protein